MTTNQFQRLCPTRFPSTLVLVYSRFFVVRDYGMTASICFYRHSSITGSCIIDKCNYGLNRMESMTSECEQIQPNGLVHEIEQQTNQKHSPLTMLPPRRARTILITVPLVSWYDLSVLSSPLSIIPTRHSHITFPFTINRN